MHSDGDIRSLVDDIVDSGVEVINLQDLVNGKPLENIKTVMDAMEKYAFYFS